MTCEDCRAAFELEKNRVQAVNACSVELCFCENHSVSCHSPGTVKDDEIIHYLVATPDGRHENGTLLPSNALQLFRNGMSVLRDIAEDDEFIHTINELEPYWKVKARRLEGVLSFRASVVKYKDDQRLCGVYDSGMPEKPHHADLMCVEVTSSDGVQLSKTKRDHYERQRIKDVVDLMGNEFTESSAFRNGIFSKIVVAA